MPARRSIRSCRRRMTWTPAVFPPTIPAIFPASARCQFRAGDAAVLDYRLPHGTHANEGPRRDCILLSFIPDWTSLPPELKAHLVMHSAQPGIDEAAAAGACDYADLLPTSAGAASLAINRCPPATFNVRDVNPAT